MGGNALKQGSVRVDYATYEKVRIFILNRMGMKSGSPRNYVAKESFGDIDIVHTGFPRNELRKLLVKVFNATEIVTNGPCISFDFHNPKFGVEFGEGKGVQVDLIQVKPEHYEFSLGYYSFNDLGNLVGVIARSKGFKFGNEGLFYRYDHGRCNNMNYVPVTDNFDRAIKFLGFEPYCNFKSLEEIFSYVATSKYFDPFLFQFESLNHVNRIRNAKRPVYMKFLEWLAEKKYVMRVDEEGDLKKDLLVEALHKFPDFETRLSGVVSGLLLKESVKKVYNGSVVSEWTGLVGKDLGHLMHEVNESYGSDVLLNIDAIYNLDELKGRVQEIYNLL